MAREKAGPGEDLRKLEDRLRVLTEAMRVFAEATADYDHLLEQVARKTAEALSNTCTVQLLSPDRTTLTPAAIHATDPAVLEKIRRLLAAEPIVVASHALYRRVIEEGEPVLIAKVDPGEHRRVAGSHAEIAELTRTHSGLIVPLRARGESIGALSLSRWDPKFPSFDEHDRELAQTLAEYAALALSNSKLLRDIRHQLTEREKTEEALAKSEAQLRQSQKMEAVGRLAGGVAHDFNNLLSIILSLSQGIESELPRGSPLGEDAREIHRAGQRAAGLTRQLLAFSRRQVLEPRILDLNALLVEMGKMMRRLVGENIAIQTQVARDLRKVKADPGLLEQVIVNLVVNARDAMPSGGKLTLETANVDLDPTYAESHLGVTPGPYVLLAVSDTGVGMDKATQERLFEPFFTTKEKGRGTGLGLSTALGIVQQSGGHLWVYSEPGKGSTFKVYLPETREREEDLPSPPPVSDLRGSETVLLAEDDEALRSLAALILRKSGYQVLEAQDGADAISLAQAHPGPIHLLLTDVVMPGMGGRELSEALSRSGRAPRVLYMSGYTENSIAHSGILQPGIALLQKPITPEALLRKVREVLNAAEPTPG